jgi:ABC-type nickel/cobalt efflux system permease component RcnA
MLILGLLLVVLSGAAGVLLIAYNNGGAAETVTVFGRDLGSYTMMQAFVAGLVVALVFMLGLWMIMSAGRRARENRARYRDARREAKTAAKERDELAEQLRHEEENRHQHVASNTDTMVTPPAGTPVPQDNRGHDARGLDNRGHDTDQTVNAPPASRHTAHGQQPVITNITPGNSPTR